VFEPLTYLGFHALFVVPPLALLAATRPFARLPPARRRAARVGVAAMVLVAVVYTTPWDSYLVRRGVWTYGPGVVAVRFHAVPLGEYLFFALQPLLTGLWLYVYGFDPTAREGDFDRRPRALGAAACLALAVVGGVFFLRTGWGVYLGAILAWACPVLALQWAVGGGYLVRTWRRWVVGVAVPTLYLCAVDAVAIGLGLWTIAPATSTGLVVLGLPIEEGVFFLVTNLLLVSGLVLFEWVVTVWR
jgi:hypothetical protein